MSRGEPRGLWRRTRVALLGVWLASADIAGASAADLVAEVPGRLNLSYFTLMKHVVLDLEADDKGGATGHKVAAFRHILGKDFKADPAETIALTSVTPIAVPGDANRLILFADLGPAEDALGDATFLALFSLAPKPKLLDLVEIETDRFTDLKQSPLTLGPGAPLILVDNSHDNSNESYDAVEMIFVRGDRLRLIDSVFALGRALCSYRSVEELKFATLPDAGPYRAVHVALVNAVTQEGERCDESKGPRPGVTTYQAIYRWDGSRGNFVTLSRQLKRKNAADLEP